MLSKIPSVGVPIFVLYPIRILSSRFGFGLTKLLMFAVRPIALYLTTFFTSSGKNSSISLPSLYEFTVSIVKGG